MFKPCLDHILPNSLNIESHCLLKLQTSAACQQTFCIILRTHSESTQFINLHRKSKIFQAYMHIFRNNVFHFNRILKPCLSNMLSNSIIYMYSHLLLHFYENHAYTKHVALFCTLIPNSFQITSFYHMSENSDENIHMGLKHVFQKPLFQAVSGPHIHK